MHLAVEGQRGIGDPVRWSLRRDTYDVTAAGLGWTCRGSERRSLRAVIRWTITTVAATRADDCESPIGQCAR